MKTGALTFIKSRARKIERFYNIPRRAALELAQWDWDFCFATARGAK